MNSYNVYEKLYADTKANFTIVKNNNQYSLGEYMLMKAGKKNLPAERKESANSIVLQSFSYIKDKLTVKKLPPKDKTIRRFPLRTMASALASALIVCTLALSVGVFSGKNINSKTPLIVEPEISDVNETDTNAQNAK